MSIQDCRASGNRIRHPRDGTPQARGTHRKRWMFVARALLLVVAAGASAWGQDMMEPVRPGQPGSRPFWNAHAQRFIFPPAFDVKEVAGVDRYLYTLVSSADSLPRAFESTKPWHPLTPIWNALPLGVISLSIAAISGGDTALLFERTFMKSPAFDGTVPAPAYDYAESAQRCLRDLFHQEKLQVWLTTGKPFAYYPKYAYPAKMVGAVIEGMATYASIARDSAEARAALAIAESAAAFLQSITFPPGSPLGGWPPTFWEDIDHDIHPIYPDEVLATEPARTGMAYLTLAEATGNRHHLEAARKIADTYIRTQLPSGSWYQRMRITDGSPKEQNLLVPTLIIMFLDRLGRQDPHGEYARTSNRAYRWILEHPLRTYNWEAQFEDTRPRALYRNLSHREPVQFAALLFRRGENNPELLREARELLRFAEDAFVVWSPDDPVLSAQLFRPGSRWNGNDPYFGSDWFVPAAVEQFVFFTPISSSSAAYIEAYAAAYRATGERQYLDRARALASTLTHAQRYWGGGEIPTHLRRVMPELNWLNVSVASAEALLELGSIMERETRTKRRE
jgi:hypothetical protein